MQKRTILFGLCLLFVWAEAFSVSKDDKKQEATLFCIASLSNGDKPIFDGDSVLVSLTLYSTAQFVKVSSRDKDLPKVKNATVAKVSRNRQLTQSIAVYEEKQYYAVVAEQYWVKVEKVDNFEFPVRKFDVELKIKERTREHSSFEEFFGFDSPFNVRYRKVEEKCESDELKFKSVKRPPKTIKDLQQKGTLVF